MARILNQIFKHSEINFQIVHDWISGAESFVEKEIRKREQDSASNNKTDLDVVEIDDLYTYVKKTSQ